MGFRASCLAHGKPTIDFAWGMPAPRGKTGSTLRKRQVAASTGLLLSVEEPVEPHQFLRQIADGGIMPGVEPHQIRLAADRFPERPGAFRRNDLVVFGFDHQYPSALEKVAVRRRVDLGNHFAE